MSSVYATEPATAGRVILETTHGPLEIHLWCRECPQTTRMFLQLCLDGFYDNMVFHRIVSNFLIQTGALRQDSGASPMTTPEAKAYRAAVQAPQALDRRAYEVNSRIRFNHRGQVAMALGMNDDDDVEDLQPQFFITLEDAPYLDGKHVILGTISGPTIFNALRIGRTETDENTHQPVDMANATRIKSVKIVENPIHQDLTPHPNPPWRAKPKAEQANSDNKQKKKKKKRKGKFDTNVLSFGSEFDEEDSTLPTKTKKGMQSSHDVVESKVLSKQVDEKVKENLKEKPKEDSDVDEPIDKKKASKKRQRESEDENGDEKPGFSSSKNTDEPAPVEFSSRKQRKAEKKEDKSDDEKEKPRKKQAAAQKEAASKSAPKPSLVEARRLKYMKGKKSKKEREEDTLNKLMAFKSTLQTAVEERKSTKGGGSAVWQNDDSLAARMARKAQKDEGEGDAATEGQAPTYHGQVLESDDEDGDNRRDGEHSKGNWMGIAFKCKKHVDHASRDLGGDGRDADDYEVLDSRRGGGRDRHHRRDDKKRHKHKSSQHKPKHRVKDR